MWILGHRGASAAAPENTLAAFSLAMVQHATGVELDVYQAEDEIVVIHDRWLNRTTNGKGMVTSHPLSYLRSLDAGKGEQIPLLSEVFGILPPYAVLNVEIKHLTNVDSWLRKIREGLAQNRFPAENLIISSFNHRWIRQIKQAWPEVRIGALTATYPENGLGFAHDLDAFSLHMALDVVDECYVKEAHNAGLKVLVYTVDHPEDMQMLKAWGVDGIFTNVPDIARDVLA
ncbi:glycerophosphodiester phosphodiesterase [Alteromonas lipolytica]|uniref:Glycerophosphodiester phosphodiesterase n=1 Tax=Alteromonas lipolytica TaxID=1856405 RepID=A0A1E8FBF1_9ALTE|nr:glycerophosphodiester phosphodiesterase family protein [Alteromonas lipolytica]OFI33262.1 glycerophosphodiester phosphodiesterase [Alteromonas lipolytica]GGF61174.1 glycerophosphoryl diester phosphodiesterase [Alteromonas lipolytica]